MNIENDSSMLLLILPKEKQLIALNKNALTKAQASRKEIEKGYKDAMILSRDGTLRRIERVDIIKPYGKSSIRKLISMLTSTWHVSVQFSDVLSWHIEEIKNILLQCILVNGGLRNLDEPIDIEEKDKLIKAIVASSTISELFDVLDWPSQENSLDVL